MKTLFVYVAEFCPLTWESEFGIISIHFKKRDAELAMEEHREKYLDGEKAEDWQKWRVRRIMIE